MGGAGAVLSTFRVALPTTYDGIERNRSPKYATASRWIPPHDYPQTTISARLSLTPAHSARLRDEAPCRPGLAVVWAVLRPALAPLITAINSIHRCDNAATRSSKTTTSQPYVTGVDAETRSPTPPPPAQTARHMHGAAYL